MELPSNIKIDEILDVLQHPSEYSIDDVILNKIQKDIDSMSRDKDTISFRHKIYFAQALLFYHWSDDFKATQFVNASIQARGGLYPDAERFLENLNGNYTENNIEQQPVGGPFRYIINCYQNYASTEGRARRAEYWYFYLYFLIGVFICSFIDLIIGYLTDSMSADSTPNYQVFYYLFLLANIVPLITVTVRRLHDISYSGSRYLIMIIPIIGWLVGLIWMVQDGDEGNNKYGSDPLYFNAYDPKN